MSFAEAVPRDGAKSHQCGRQVVERLFASGIKPEAAVVGTDGCAFVIDSRDAERAREAAEGLDVTLTLHEGCARIALTRNATDWPLPSLDRVLRLLDDAGIAIVHLAGDGSGLTIVVEDSEADRVVNLFSGFYVPAHARTTRLAS